MKWSEFTWSMDDMIFLLENLQSLKEGLSCFEPELLLVKPQGRKKPMANFIPACELAADIEIRLERANGDGTILKWHYTQGIEIVEIARGISCPASEVHYRIDRALRYISGRKPRKRSYDDFCDHKKYIKPIPKLPPMPTPEKPGYC